MKIRTNLRDRRGNMLILITAVIVGIIIAMLLFGLGYMRLIGTNNEQRTAIEAAALAAARDCSRIVIPTAECGWVSLSDYVPNGTATNAPDGFPLPVRSINTLIGTARLDLIIADKLNQDVMRNLARIDMVDALDAKDQLVTALNDALTPSGMGQDKDGNPVRPYQSALAAYQSNQIRMTGGDGSSSYIAGSLQLSLGSLTSGTATAIPIPQPTGQAPVANDKKIGNFYKSYVNIPVTAGGVTTDFVFGGIGDSINIVDHKKWASNIPGLPYQIPTIIRAEADQSLASPTDPTARRVKVIACAQPASVHDPLPAPGALSVSMPDGPVPEITNPGELYAEAELNDNGDGGADLLTADVGDYPSDAGSRMVELCWPEDSSDSNHATADVWRVALHDWIRRAGTKANISSAVSMQSQGFVSLTPNKINWLTYLIYPGSLTNIGQIPAGSIHIYTWNPDGTIQYQARPLTPYPVYVSSHRQMYSETMGAVNKSGTGKLFIPVLLPGASKPKDVVLTDDWDVYIRDEVRNRGVVARPVPSPPQAYNNFGGNHAGEPLGKPSVAKIEDTRMIATDISEGTAIASSLGHEGFGAGSGGKGKGKGKGNSGVQPGAQDKGWPPIVAPQDDFADGMVPAAPVVPALPAGSGVRPTYMTTGTAVDFKLRRQVDVTEILKAVGMPDDLDTNFGNTGYVGEVGQILP
ncbi:MAG: hypothetical protein AB7W16_09015 [Candidatus Obscuribacterales bacterium]